MLLYIDWYSAKYLRKILFRSWVFSLHIYFVHYTWHPYHQPHCLNFGKLPGSLELLFPRSHLEILCKNKLVSSQISLDINWSLMSTLSHSIFKGRNQVLNRTREEMTPTQLLNGRSKANSSFLSLWPMSLPIYHPFKLPWNYQLKKTDSIFL